MKGQGKFELTLFYIADAKVKSQSQPSAVPAPRSLLPRHTARFPRNAKNKARKSGCSVVVMTGFWVGAGEINRAISNWKLEKGRDQAQ
jgi:hypothetical protein